MTTALTQIDAAKLDILKLQPKIAASLPKHIPVERFMRVVAAALTENPDIALKCEPASLFAATIKAATDGLLPDGREAALVPFKGKAKYMPMVAGLLKKARNSGEIAVITAQCIYKKDKFVYHLGDEERIEHEPPPLGDDRGDFIGAYSIATLKDGTKIRRVMDKGRIDKVRAVSQMKNGGPWNDWYDEMAMKTVIRALSKFLPMSTDLESLMHNDDDLTDPNKAIPVAPVAAPAQSRVETILEVEPEGKNAKGKTAEKVTTPLDAPAEPAAGEESEEL